MKKLILGLAAILFLTGASIASANAYTKESTNNTGIAVPYLFETWNQTFTQTQTLPNGFDVRIVGVGTKTTGGIFIRSGVNAVVQVVKNPQRKQSGTLQSIKLIHNTVGFGFIGKNGVGQTANFDMISECNTSDCYLLNQNYQNGMIIFGTVTLKAEVKFDNGTYTIYTNVKENQQRTNF